MAKVLTPANDNSKFKFDKKTGTYKIRIPGANPTKPFVKLYK